ncbi:MAG: hypothetical protein H6815_13260 [Phycisphaeraceae bacterium]|nr:hypothetical protein [Phycisphaerales bacterium]MCB9861407.1 hypothetical protein [Phycisphaeraceae bacterium]
MSTPAKTRIQLPGLIAIGMIVIASIAVISGAIPVVRALLDSGTGVDAEIATSNDASVDLTPLVAQIDGRTAFFVPDAPPPPPAPDPAPVVKRDDGPPPPPSHYGGPKIVAMIDGKVWLDNGDHLKVGEEGGGVAIKRINAPWSATVEWKDVEFDVPLFDRDKIVIPKTNESSQGAVTSQREGEPSVEGGA